MRQGRALDARIRKLNPRWFLTRSVHHTPSTTLVQLRWALSYMRGPMTLGDIRRALGEQFQTNNKGARGE